MHVLRNFRDFLGPGRPTPLPYTVREVKLDSMGIRLRLTNTKPIVPLIASR